MKKLIILAAVVCAAIASQAAAYDWKTSTTGKVYMGGTTDTYTGTAYIFADTGTTTQALIFDALVANTAVTTLGALDNSAVTAGAIKVKSDAADKFNYAGDITAYFVIVDGDNFYIGPTANAVAQEVGAATIQFNAKTSSQAAFKDASAGFAGAGWYQSVPEPTSGLLLLLGMAGLALKRKQA